MAKELTGHCQQWVMYSVMLSYQVCINPQNKFASNPSAKQSRSDHNCTYPNSGFTHSHKNIVGLPVPRRAAMTKRRKILSSSGGHGLEPPSPYL